LIAAQLGLPAATVALMRLAAPLHDVGKLALTDGILPRKSSVACRSTRSQARRSCQCSSSKVLQLAEEIARTHHERWDGTGYPRMLRGAAIPISGRIVAVADVFDALAFPRPYKEAWPLEDAVAEIQRLRGRHFDPRVVNAFAALDHRALLTDQPNLAVVA
jgi:response regulator RpfG family c-di-GMP phosphodiesterase